MEGDKQTTEMCSILAIDHSNISYRVCSSCEKTIPENPNPNPLCKFCNSNSSKLVFRLVVSIATDKKVFTVIIFDRAAKVLLGCSADEFFNFANYHPFAAQNMSKILEAEMFKMTLSKPKLGYAQHLRVTSVIPLRTGFRPAIETLRELYNRGK
ncbi:hypothetical protein ACFE04_005626 [Oxalis oulophora]